MIESINIRNIATFDENGIHIKELKKINFIYGANGCGKTTLSNFLYNPIDVKFDKCSLSWKNSQELSTLVYNKEFRERNFGNGKLSGVFTLGEATADEVKAIEEKVITRKELKENGAKKRLTVITQEENKTQLESEFRETTWTKVYKKYEPSFKEAFAGNLSKEKFKTKLLHEYSNNKEPLVDIDSLKEKANTIFGEIPVMITQIGVIKFDRILQIEADPIWKKIVVGKGDVDIAKLIQKLNITDWVNQGREYINEEDEVCPFCQQKTISTNIKKQLESFFDETYLNDIKLIKELKLEYTTLIQNLINELNLVETSQKNFSKSKLEIDKFSAYLKTLTSQNTTNSERLILKGKEPSRNIELASLKEQLTLLADIVEKANSEIKKHNVIVTNYNTEKTKLIKSIWRFVIDEHSIDLTKGINALNDQIKIKLAEYKALDLEIKELSKNVTSIQPTIDEINRLLKSYGFTNFEIVPALDDGFYQIQREDGSIAETTLSEGEITFITFLYYLQLSKGGISEDTVNNERVLIVDDPISSLDSNILFVVSTLIKEIIKDIKSDSGNIKQLILLTHNVYFHKEVTFIDGRTKCCGKTNYWILRKNGSVTNIQPFVMSNPIQSSYELLWQELKSDEVKSSITVQNVMRRIIENYFKLLGKYGDDDLIKKFKTKEEQEICRSLISWINDGSHSINDDLFVELQDRTIENYQKVFKDIFKLTNHAGHYDMMMGISEVEEEKNMTLNS
jgi:wobble nucleotide-excising tRNase